MPEELLWKATFNSDNSIETYDQAIRSFLLFIGVSSPEELRKVEHGHVIAFKKYLQNSGCSPRTINNRLSAISSLFNHLIDKQVVRSQENVKRTGYGTLKGLRDKAILATLFYTGCRVSEVCKLKMKDFYQEQGYYVMDFWIKGGKRNRLAIHQELQVLINSYLNVAGHGMENSSYLFLPLRNAPNCSDPIRIMSRKTVDYLFKKYAKQAFLYGVTPHSARATFITEALENNCPIEAVQKTVGHSQIKTIQMYDKRRTKYRESASFAVRY